MLLWVPAKRCKALLQASCSIQCVALLCSVQVPVEVSDEDDAAEAAAHEQLPKALPHRHQLAGGPASSSITQAISHKLSSGGSMIGRQASRRHSQRRTAESRRQASLRMASASRTDPTFAAAAAAALEQETHGHHHHSHLHNAAHHLLHHGHHHGTAHATITISADAVSTCRQASGTGSVDGAVKRSGSPFASADGQSQTAAVVLGLTTAGRESKAETKSKAMTVAVVPPGWPASGATGTSSAAG